MTQDERFEAWFEMMTGRWGEPGRGMQRTNRERLLAQEAWRAGAFTESAVTLAAERARVLAIVDHLIDEYADSEPIAGYVLGHARAAIAAAEEGE